MTPEERERERSLVRQAEDEAERDLLAVLKEMLAVAVTAMSFRIFGYYGGLVMLALYVGFTVRAWRRYVALRRALGDW